MTKNDRAERPHKERQMELSAIPIEMPDGLNVIVGQAHFIKAVEDLHEALAGANPYLRFGIAFCEASGPCLIRCSGNAALEEDGGTRCLAEGDLAGRQLWVTPKNWSQRRWTRCEPWECQDRQHHIVASNSSRSGTRGPITR